MRQAVANNHIDDIKKSKIQLEIRVDQNNNIVFRSWKMQVIRYLEKTTESTENRNRYWGESG